MYFVYDKCIESVHSTFTAPFFFVGEFVKSISDIIKEKNELNFHNNISEKKLCRNLRNQMRVVNYVRLVK